MAMYVALYDSTGYGTYRETQFVPGANIGPQILGDINRDLSVLNPGVVNANSFIGDLLIPVNPGTDSQQDFIFLFPGQGLVVSVPEPVTISLMAGALGMLALAGDSLRGKFAVTVK